MPASLALMAPLALMCLLLMLQVLIARRVGSVTGLILGAQAAYWALAFVLMPGYLALFKPTAEVELADHRLMASGYESGVSAVLWISCAGQAAFLITIALIAGRRQASVFMEPIRPTSLARILMPVATVFWVLGWIGRVAGSAGVVEVASAFTRFGVVGGAFLIVFAAEGSRRVTPTIVYCLLSLELIWAFTYGSKAAMMVPLLALCTRWLLRRDTHNLGRRLLFVGSTAVAGFLIIQPMRGITTASEVSSRLTGDFAEARGALISILERFDGFSAVTDAAFMGPERWMGLGEYLQRAVLAILPKGPLFRVEESLGQLWTSEVRATSFPNQTLGVPLAFGPTAEGYAVGGFLGVFIANVFLAVLTLLFCSFLEGHKPLFVIFAGNIVFSTVLFEQGILGILSASNKSLQMTALAWVIILTSRSLRSRGVNPRHRRHVGQSSSLPEQSRDGIELSHPKLTLGRSCQRF